MFYFLGFVLGGTRRVKNMNAPHKSATTGGQREPWQAVKDGFSPSILLAVKTTRKNADDVARQPFWYPLALLSGSGMFQMQIWTSISFLRWLKA